MCVVLHNCGSMAQVASILDSAHLYMSPFTGHGVYFCTNISSGLPGPLALLNNKVSPDTCMPADTSLDSGECTVSTEQPVKQNSM